MRFNLLVSLLPLPVALQLMGCAQTTRWKGGDSCTQLSKNREEILEVEDRIARLEEAEDPGDREARVAEIRRLKEKKRDLQRSNATLVGMCAPPEGTAHRPRDPQVIDRRRERR